MSYLLTQLALYGDVIPLRLKLDYKKFISDRVKRKKTLDYFVPKILGHSDNFYCYKFIEGKVFSEVVTAKKFYKSFSDKKLDDNEVKFLRALRKRLNIDENLILDRFGDVKALGIEKNQEYENLSASDLAEAFVFEELEELKLGKSTSES